MCDFIKNKGNLKELADDIIKRAIALGSRDNISVLILKLWINCCLINFIYLKYFYLISILIR